MELKELSDFPCRSSTNKPVGGKCKRCYAEHRAKGKGNRVFVYKPRLNNQQKDELVKSYVDGIGCTTLAVETGITPQSVRELLMRRSVSLRSSEEANGLLEAKRQVATGKTLDERKKHRRLEKKARWESVIANALVGKSCVDCGYNNWLALEFDHRDPTEKTYDISKAKHCCEKTLLKELAKCDVVCANCHAIRTANMFGSWRLRHVARGTRSVVTNLALGLPVHVLGAVLASHEESSGVAGDIAHAGEALAPAGGVGDEHEALERSAGVVEGESGGAVGGVHGVSVSSV